jgi:hypothetical protein
MNALNERNKFIFLGILSAIAFFGIYFATKQNEGKWICKTGTWVAEGKPSSTRPPGVCK